MLLRWLLPVIAALSVLTGSVTAYAAAGMIGESVCCCPDPDTCKCHDHDGQPAPAPELKRCSGEAKSVAPHLVPTIVPELVLHAEHRTRVTIVHALRPPPAERFVEIESPPF